MFIIKKNNIVEVEMINKGNVKSLVRFKGKDLLIDNGNIYYSKQEANMARAEKKITSASYLLFAVLEQNGNTQQL